MLGRNSRSFHIFPFDSFYKEAIPYYKKALDIGPKTYLLFLNLGTAYRRSGQPREARIAYEQGLALAESELVKNPRQAYISSCAAYLYARLGETRRATLEAARAMGMANGAANVRWMAVLTYEALLQRDQALALLPDAPDWILRRLNQFPDLADLQADSRFQRLLVSRNIR